MQIPHPCAVAVVEPLNQNIYSMVVSAPHLATELQPGQFVDIKCGDSNLLRRPISVCDCGEGKMRFVFQQKGRGTIWLARRKTGDRLDVLGPLGHGFDLSKAGSRPFFIGGGIGVPPMLYAMKRAAGGEVQPTAILGFRNHLSVILEKEFTESCETVVMTDDGSYGRQGTVADALLERIAEATAIYCCGPRPMLKAVAAIALEKRVFCQVSLEERMGCGVGACLVCACALRDEKNGATRYGHVCKDGPVFAAEEVQW